MSFYSQFGGKLLLNCMQQIHTDAKMYSQYW